MHVLEILIVVLVFSLDMMARKAQYKASSPTGSNSSADNNASYNTPLSPRRQNNNGSPGTHAS